MRNVLVIGLLLIGLPLISGLSVQAQDSGTTRPLAPYQRQTPSRIPAFSIQLADGLVAPKRIVFTDQDVVAGRPVLIAYIDPACSHCIQEALKRVGPGLPPAVVGQVRLPRWRGPGTVGRCRWTERPNAGISNRGQSVHPPPPPAGEMPEGTTSTESII